MNDIVYRDGYALFWNGHFSNWYPSAFKLNDKVYNCVEQWMMSEKARLFGDTASEQLIMESESPKEQKALGRQVLGFDSKIWEQHCDDIVFNGCFAKYQQNDQLKKLMLESSGFILVEASPHDQIWGIGLSADHPDATHPDKWLGQNRLGKALMKVRDFLRDDMR